MEKPSSSTGNPNNVDDNTMTLGDFLEQELQLENDANAVLGGCDDEHCTYDMGYVPRQALYSCKTCTKDAPPAGICLACSYHCHEGHELVELYTKRYFRCDCGNTKFGELKCSLTPIKDRENEKNHYNQNFQGLYCSCARPYPDPEDEVGDDMIQCCVCEDWYHSRHLNVEFPGEENYAEMICTSCTTRLTFLGNYRFLSVNDADKPKTTEDAVVDVVNTEDNENKVGAEDQTSKQEVHCKIQNSTEKPFEGVATFWMSNFRSFLCKCPKCKVMYEKLNVSWITNESDTVHAYEEKGKSNGEQGSKPSQYEQGMQALAGMDRVQQMEAILNMRKVLIIRPTNDIRPPVKEECCWDTKLSKRLLELYAEWRDKVKTRRQMWSTISEIMINEYSMNITANHCENRWRVLARNYRKYMDNKSRPGRKKRPFDFVEEMDEICGNKRTRESDNDISTASVNNYQEHSFVDIQIKEEPETVPESNLQPPEPEIVQEKRVIKRKLSTIEKIRLDRLEYQNKRLSIESEKLKLLAIRNDLIKERNRILLTNPPCSCMHRSE